MTASARDIRAKLRRQDEAERRKREDAVVAVGEAAAAAVKARADNDAALRTVFEAALKPHASEGRAGQLRKAFEEALAESPEVLETEMTAGRAVLAATEFRVTQSQLAEFTAQRVEDLRRWAQLARQAMPQSAEVSGAVARDGRGRDVPVSGFAVVASAGEDMSAARTHNQAGSVSPAALNEAGAAIEAGVGEAE